LLRGLLSACPCGRTKDEWDEKQVPEVFMIISIHIPKTAGTTLGMYLENGVDHQIIFDYGGSIIDYSVFKEKHKELLERFRAIHGHFRYSKYSSVFPDANFITCLRHPVDRTISNYNHVMRDKDPNNFLYRRIKKYNLDLVGFAQLPLVRNTQTSYLRGRVIEDYDFVGNSEDLPASIEVMCRKFGIPKINPVRIGPFFNGVPRVNMNLRAWVKSKLHMDGITSDVRKKIEEATQEDMDLYRRAVEKLEADKKKYL
jgi:hypothetical protein